MTILGSSGVLGVVGARGSELGYADMTTNVVQAGITQLDLAGLTITVIEGTRPYYVVLEVYAMHGPTSGGNVHALITDSVGTILETITVNMPSANIGRGGTARVRITPGTPGSLRTFKVQTLSAGGGIPTIESAATARTKLYAVET